MLAAAGSFLGNDEGVLKKLPPAFSRLYPAKHAHRCAVTKELWDLLLEHVAKYGSFSGLAEIVSNLRHQQYRQQQLGYLSACDLLAKVYERQRAEQQRQAEQEAKKIPASQPDLRQLSLHESLAARAAAAAAAAGPAAAPAGAAGATRKGPPMFAAFMDYDSWPGRAPSGAFYTQLVQDFAAETHMCAMHGLRLHRFLEGMVPLPLPTTFKFAKPFGRCLAPCAYARP